jgi:hypothetical protein
MKKRIIQEASKVNVHGFDERNYFKFLPLHLFMLTSKTGKLVLESSFIFFVREPF